MHATTIKLEEDILNQIYTVKPATQSLSAFVKQIIRKHLEQQKLQEAGIRYAEFLQHNSEEQVWLAEWDAADLAAPVQKRPKV